MPPSDDQPAALEAVADARVVVVIGASDAGKTTLVAALGGELAMRGARVGVVDSDVGQSEIGPPTTVGLGEIRGRVARLSDAVPIAFHFVGVTSPARDIRGVVEATRRMVARARAEGLSPILVDTSGLVLGWPGQRLKHQKITALDPDVLLVLERDDECAPLVARYASASRPRVLRLSARGRPGSRSQTARRQHRQRAFDAYFRNARVVSLARSSIAIEAPRGVAPGDAVSAVCGLDDAEGNTLAVGLVEDVTPEIVRVRAPLPPSARVTAVRIGRERADGTPLTPGRVGAA